MTAVAYRAAARGHEPSPSTGSRNGWTCASVNAMRDRRVDAAYFSRVGRSWKVTRPPTRSKATAPIAAPRAAPAEGLVEAKTAAADDVAAVSTVADAPRPRGPTRVVHISVRTRFPTLESLSRPTGLQARHGLRALEAAGVALPVDHASSDSFPDLPLLRAARTAHLVASSPSDQSRLQRALGLNVEVLRWAAAPGRNAPPRTRGCGI